MGVIFHSAPRYAANDGVLDAVAPGLGEALLSSFERHGELCLVVRRESVAEVLRQLRDGHAYQQLMEIAGADYPERTERFEVVYHLLSLTANHRLRIKCSTDEAMPVPTVTHLWPNAGWLEREVYDMFGVLFEGNPDLRRILTDYGFRGHPFRKDFPLTGHVEMRYSEEEKRVVYEPVQLPQDFRNFDFTSPWEGADYVLPGDEKASPPASPGDPKVTEKPGDTGAGAKTDAKAAERQSAGSPAQENGGKDVPPPAPTSGGAGGDRSKDAR